MEATPRPDVLRYEFMDVLPSNFICSLCKDVLYNPQLVSCCNQHICEPCIKQSKINKSSCPLCSSKKFSIKSDPVFNKKLNSFQILCTNKMSGCTWSGPLGNLDNHLDPNSGTCDYATVSCPLKCGITLARHKMNKHTCSTSNIDQGGSRNSSNSTNSSGTNRKNSTPASFIFCPCYSVGCTVVLSQEELPSHINESLLEHVKQLTEYTEQIRKREEKVKTREERIEKREAEMATREADLDRQMELLVHKDLVSTEKTNGLEDLTRKVEELQVLVDAKNLEIEGLCQKVSKLNSRSRLESQYILPPTPAVYSYRFIMNNFNQYCKGTGGKLCWQSDAFYTHDEGYKMSFVVDVVLGLLRLSLCILPGKYDDQLAWPLQGSLTILLLNQVDNYNHYSYKFVYNESTHSTVAGRVTTIGNVSEKNVSLSQKLSCDDLPMSPSRNLCYLQNNVLKFSISQIDLII